jgi:hypothetical protein
MELFVHNAGYEQPEIVEIDASAFVQELLVGVGPDERVWVEETDEEVDLTVTLEVAEIRHHHHVHRGHCGQVEVIVRFNGSDYERPFTPARTIRAVEEWAFGKKAANFSPEQAAKHVLAVPGADHFLEPGVHVGSLVTAGSCRIILDLLPRKRFEG